MRARQGVRGRRAAGGLLLAAAALTALACGGAEEGARAAEDERLVITGSSTMAPLVSELAKRFESRRPGVRVEVQAGGSGRGIADVASGVAHLGMASRALRGDERRLHALPIARDGIGIIVHRSNPVESLETEEAAAVYRGEVTRWSALGGEDAAIVVVNKAEGRGTRAVFEARFGLEGKTLVADVVAGHNEHAIQSVAGSPHAIGYVSIGTAEAEISRGVPIRLLALGDVAASSENVAEGSYRLARPLHLVSRGPPPGLAARFVEFARSAQAARIVEEQHFVPVAP